MKNLTLEHIADACGGTYHGPQEQKAKEVSAVFTDSRKAVPDGLFVAIKGARVDAHDFIDSVIESGALAALSEKDLGEKEYPLAGTPGLLLLGLHCHHKPCRGQFRGRPHRYAL